jgi:hypothetical protein
MAFKVIAEVNLHVASSSKDAGLFATAASLR